MAEGTGHPPLRPETYMCDATARSRGESQGGERETGASKYRFDPRHLLALPADDAKERDRATGETPWKMNATIRVIGDSQYLPFGSCRNEVSNRATLYRSSPVGAGIDSGSKIGRKQRWSRRRSVLPGVARSYVNVHNLLYYVHKEGHL
jgi:hypothetical protein